MRLRKKQKAPTTRFALPGVGVLAGLGIIGGAIVLLRKRGKQIKDAALDATESVPHKGSDHADGNVDDLVPVPGDPAGQSPVSDPDD